ncbi:hypothetical protein EII34_07740 [Arachnia propionica]|uniref:Uncharacterized protein n=1 Tax=Arachnia propionica TaxID=1750 RepID=A0A3P1T7Q3_9ACTN|nr:hypothetical protein [Arachnia propionica]MDO5083989.1 hypothetical protein [Arachnia propionica]RRD05215.1 hypothetical protein EII34_07740 [Arachnia propionica]
MNPWKDIWIWIDALPRGRRIIVTAAATVTLWFAVVLMLQLRIDAFDWIHMTLLSLAVAFGAEEGRRMRRELTRGRTHPAPEESPASDIVPPPARRTDRDD